MSKFFWALVLLISINTRAQAPATYNSDDIYTQLKKLNVLGSVLYIAAHPDDENTRLLAYFSKEKQYRTGYLSLTRGDGGQNLIGDEQGIELGMIRTQELLAARRIDGAEQFFSTAIDFGFSKNAAEALSFWNHDKILSDVVWVIRKFHPDVIITRFPGDARAGHGHHWASALLANEAFTAAADSTKFTDQFALGVKPWQAKRIFWNTYNFGSNNTTSGDQFTMDIGGFNPLLGKSYGEIAAESRSQHKSQGFGATKQRGQSLEYFKLTGGAPFKDGLMDGVNTTWERVPGGNTIETTINAIISHYNFEHPEYSVDSLVALHKALAAMPASYWVYKKMDEVSNIIVACSGLFIEATTNKPFAVIGDTLPIQFFIDKRNNNSVSLTSIQLDNFDTTISRPLATNTNVNIIKQLPVAQSKPLSQPYWLVNPSQKGYFEVADQQLIGKAENNAAYEVTFHFLVNGYPLQITKPVQYKFTDAIKGEQYEPLVVIAPFSVAATPGIALLNVHPESGKAPDPLLKFTFKSYINAATLPVTISALQGNKAVYKKDTVVNAEVGKEYSFSESLSKLYNKTGDNIINTVLDVRMKNSTAHYDRYLRSIHYDHIPDIHYTLHDNIRVITEDIKTRGKHIGYIVGAGDKVPQALEQMGYDVKLLGENDITAANLAQFDAVIAGVRAYNLHEWLVAKYDILMSYIQQGGNYIVQYNQLDLVTNTIGPYPFTIGRTRVTDENAEVHFLLPSSPVLNYPNKITAKDFEGWVQERSTYHAQNMDAHYTAPLGMHDPDEAESNGGLIIAPYGKGNFVYDGLVFFRELPAGIAGAYRLIANLIALPQNK
ncbi:PIG-L family deacetylase [Ilyomonas limi]|uniref:PIG-L family deacetylase n=1 Tax=Ilyomonas limi TaxID=2575867 RepID=A0A4U3L836_9BACT|nr:PIG-L family deacetylase [Ilyomonas limi]TKK71455.1 PIG-L family deacetylase [Ilyomonas limi]